MKTICSIVVIIIGVWIFSPPLEEMEAKPIVEQTHSKVNTQKVEVDTTNLSKKIRMVEDNLKYLENNIYYGKNK